MFDSKNLARTLIKLSTGPHADKAIEAFFIMMQQKNLMGLLPNIKKYIERSRELTSHYNNLTITSKHTLSTQDQADIIALVGADKDVIVQCIQDDSVVGGFSAVYKGHIYDGSLRNQIIQLRGQLRH
jgi:F0F1-type ATP synthase delta subunit